MILLIDNYDSFTYNLYQYLGMMGQEVKVVRNDEISLDEIDENELQAIIISPGPKTPNQAGECLNVIERFKESIPILGICLGHQCIGQVFGAEVVHAEQLFHGKTSDIHHNEDGIYKGIPNPFKGARYHSLIISNTSLPEEEIEITAQTADGVIMGIKHKIYPIYGMQFHPESILTQSGYNILYNFIKLI